MDPVRLITYSGKAQASSRVLLEDAFTRMKHNVFSESIVPRNFRLRNTNFEPDKNSINHGRISVVTVKQVKELQSRELGHSQSPEAYIIRLEEDGITTIQIVSAQGGSNALQSFPQLFFAHSESAFQLYSSYAPVSISDHSYFEHRDLNLDIARN